MARRTKQPAAERQYVVYKITNTVTGQCYVGVTGMRLRERWHKHTSLARLGDPAPLYAAMRAYSVDAFEMTVLRSGVSREDRWTAEREEIARAGSYEAGYNELPGVPQSLDDPGVPECFGPNRPPVPEARREYLRRLFRGRVDSAETHTRKCEAQRRRVNAGGNRHARGVSRGAAFRTRLSLATGGPGIVSYDGTDYPSIALAAEAAGVSKRTFARWVRFFGAGVPRMLPGRRPLAQRVA